MRGDWLTVVCCVLPFFVLQECTLQFESTWRSLCQSVGVSHWVSKGLGCSVLGGEKRLLLGARCVSC